MLEDALENTAGVRRLEIATGSHFLGRVNAPVVDFHQWDSRQERTEEP
jgi:hypothetical protein